MICCSELMKAQRSFPVSSRSRSGMKIASASNNPLEVAGDKVEERRHTILTPESLSLKYANLVKSQTMGFNDDGLQTRVRGLARTATVTQPQQEFVTATPLPSISQEAGLKLRLQKYVQAHERRLDDSSASLLHASGSHVRPLTPHQQQVSRDGQQASNTASAAGMRFPIRAPRSPRQTTSTRTSPISTISSSTLPAKVPLASGSGTRSMGWQSEWLTGPSQDSKTHNAELSPKKRGGSSSGSNSNSGGSRFSRSSSVLIPADGRRRYNPERYELLYGDEDDPAANISVLHARRGAKGDLDDDEEGEEPAFKEAHDVRKARDETFISGLAEKAQLTKSGLLSSIADTLQACVKSLGMSVGSDRGSAAASSSSTVSAGAALYEHNPGRKLFLSASSSSSGCPSPSSVAPMKKGHESRVPQNDVHIHRAAPILDTHDNNKNKKISPNASLSDPVKLSQPLPLSPPPAPRPSSPPRRGSLSASSPTQQRPQLLLQPRRVPSMSFPKWRQVTPDVRSALLKVKSLDYKLGDMKGYSSRCVPIGTDASRDP